jgi:hypothetical protein
MQMQRPRVCNHICGCAMVAFYLEGVVTGQRTPLYIIQGTITVESVCPFEPTHCKPAGFS